MNRILFIVGLAFLYSCLPCGGAYYPYIANFVITNKSKDSFQNCRLYFYETNSNFTIPKDSITCSIRQNNKNIELSYYDKYKTKEFKYIIQSVDSTYEYKIKILADECGKCDDCKPSLINVNNKLIQNKSNSIILD